MLISTVVTNWYLFLLISSNVQGMRSPSKVTISSCHFLKRPLKHLRTLLVSMIIFFVFLLLLVVFHF